MIRINKKNVSGFTLVELMIVVAIIGILAVLAVYGVTRYMKNAKTGEARNALGQVAKSAVGAYENEHSDGALLAAGSSGASNLHRVCGNAVAVPAALSSVSNKKYQAKNTGGEDWGSGDKDNGWVCLKFSLTEPQYYRYQYTTGPENGWLAVAEADLGGGGTADSSFSIGGKATGGQMRVAQGLLEGDGPSTAVVP